MSHQHGLESTSKSCDQRLWNMRCLVHIILLEVQYPPPQSQQLSLARLYCNCHISTITPWGLPLLHSNWCWGLFRYGLWLLVLRTTPYGCRCVRTIAEQHSLRIAKLDNVQQSYNQSFGKQNPQESHATYHLVLKVCKVSLLWPAWEAFGTHPPHCFCSIKQMGSVRCTMGCNCRSCRSRHMIGILVLERFFGPRHSVDTICMYPCYILVACLFKLETVWNWGFRSQTALTILRFNWQAGCMSQVLHLVCIIISRACAQWYLPFISVCFVEHCSAYDLQFWVMWFSLSSRMCIRMQELGSMV